MSEELKPYHPDRDGASAQSARTGDTGPPEAIRGIEHEPRLPGLFSVRGEAVVGGEPCK